jgi:hypothetical protein
MNTYVSTGIEAGEGVLSHEDSDNNDVSLASTLAPADTIFSHSSTIDKLGEHKGSTLVMRSLYNGSFS